jgi:hypothetical protein
MVDRVTVNRPGRLARCVAALAFFALLVGSVGLGLSAEHSRLNPPTFKSTTLPPTGTPAHPVVVKIDARSGHVIAILDGGVVVLSPTTGRIIQRLG